MSEAGQYIAVTVVVTIAIVVAIAAALLTIWRVRTRERRRDAWLVANAQPRLTAISFAFTVLLSIGGGIACALGAIAGYPFLWSPVALLAGLLASSIISTVVAFRTPKELP